jgi:hypothetical protein
MTRKRILAWTLVWTLAALLLVAWAALGEAAPRTREPAHKAPRLSPTEQYCRGLGLFAYRRTIERELGYSRTDVLSVTRQFATKNRMDATTAVWQELIVHVVYEGQPASPAVNRQAVEDTCLQWARGEHGEDATPRTTTPDARLRY